jgi:hypothetical protein
MKQIWDAEELSQHWSLNYEELELLKTKPYKSHAPLFLCFSFHKNSYLQAEKFRYLFCKDRDLSNTFVAPNYKDYKLF